MISFMEFLNEGRYVYHGTSSLHVPSILKQGILPGNGKDGQFEDKFTCITRDPEIAAKEARQTVHGEKFSRTPGVGGHPVVLKIDRLHPKFRESRGFEMDDGYHVPHGYGHTTPIKQRHAFMTPHKISHEAIVSVHHAEPGFPKYDPVKEENNFRL